MKDKFIHHERILQLPPVEKNIMMKGKHPISLEQLVAYFEGRGATVKRFYKKGGRK